MSHDPDIETAVQMHKCQVIIDMANKVEELMDMFPGMIKDQSLLYNIAGDIPINEEKMNEIVKLKILRVLLGMPYDELREYLGYEDDPDSDKYCEYCRGKYTQEYPKSAHAYKCWIRLGSPQLTQKNPPRKTPNYTALKLILNED